jgi:hypothetical protein
MPARMPDASCMTIHFRPDSRGYRAVRDAALALGIATAIAAGAGYQPSILWIGAALVLLLVGFALTSAKLIVGPDRVSFGIFGISVAFPASEIERDRFDELAFLNFFQVAMPDGRFVLIPHGAFSDTAPFEAIVALAEGQQTRHDRNGVADKTQMSLRER